MGDVDSLGQMIRRWRQERGLSQRELAVRAGLSLGAVRDLEQERSSRPRLRNGKALADALALTAAEREQLHRLTVPTRTEPAVPPGPVHVSVLGPLTVTTPAGPIAIGFGSIGRCWPGWP